jgi:hypothetical protein
MVAGDRQRAAVGIANRARHQLDLVISHMV